MSGIDLSNYLFSATQGTLGTTTADTSLFPDNATLYATLTGGIPTDYQAAVQSFLGTVQQLTGTSLSTVDTAAIASAVKAPPVAVSAATVTTVAPPPAAVTPTAAPENFHLVGIVNGTQNSASTSAPTAYTGGFSGLLAQYVNVTTDNLAISAQQPSIFIVTGAGDDAIEVFSGNNVISAGAGSNYLTGGTGNDTFFLDAVNPTTTWDTIVNFHSGDAVTIFGFIPGVSKFTFDNNLDGAVNAKGATMRIDFNGTGAINASVTFAGLSVDQGKALLTVTGTTQEGRDYLYVTH